MNKIRKYVKLSSQMEYLKKRKKYRMKMHREWRNAQKLPNEPFIFGVATSAFQIEGAYNVLGRTDSIWDVFCDLKGRVDRGDHGKMACDHFNRLDEDVELIKWLNVDAYRFSISWARIFPHKHKPNPEGIDFYRSLISKLLKNNIMPCVTLYHWDLPTWAQAEGGWTNRKCVDWFLEYATYVFNALGDDVKLWFTHNEPFCSGILGHVIGIHAPGYKSIKAGFLAVHHILLSHGMAVQAFRRLKLKGKIGIVLSVTPLYPDSISAADAKSTAFADVVSHQLFFEALFKASYPKEVLSFINKITKGKLKLHPHDLDIISEPCDFVGINYYTRGLIKTSTGGIGYEAGTPRVPVTDMGWEVIPYALKTMIERIRREYTMLPIYITENGAAYPDHLENDYQVHDQLRIEYYQRHLELIHHINKEGADIRGYFVWSLMDNFEWQEGYSKRFGLYYVDYSTQNRYPKDSAYFYAQYIQDYKRHHRL